MSAFERLDAWKVCHELVLALHRFIKSLPDSQQDDALICDVMRAAILATAKIARGSGTHHRRMFQRCVDLAAGQLGELGYHLMMAREFGVLPPEKWKEFDVLRGRAVFYTFKLYISLGVSPDAGTSPDTEGEGVRDP